MANLSYSSFLCTIIGPANRLKDMLLRNAVSQLQLTVPHLLTGDNADCFLREAILLFIDHNYECSFPFSVIAETISRKYRCNHWKRLWLLSCVWLNVAFVTEAGALILWIFSIYACSWLLAVLRNPDGNAVTKCNQKQIILNCHSGKNVLSNNKI